MHCIKAAKISYLDVRLIPRLKHLREQLSLFNRRKGEREHKEEMRDKERERARESSSCYT